MIIKINNKKSILNSIVKKIYKFNGRIFKGV